ncbi:hypothetical protein MXM81_22630 [Serratia plymuthica]|uniref:MrpH family fimbial adhesin n=1 Tax=Serratia plymuthica TaxID=82996 RepID=UPI002DBA9334|nr:hypothetical protein [Serratia plymuthica]MEB6541872.1 hypothetical protein [Serratia plymuthica]
MNTGHVNNLTLGWAAVLLLFSVFFSSESKSAVTVEWDLRGDDLYYVITDLHFVSSSRIDCGQRFNRTKCYVGVTLNPYNIWGDEYVQWKDQVSSLRGVLAADVVVREWASTSMPKHSVIYNWPYHVAHGRKCIRLNVVTETGNMFGMDWIGNSCDGTMNPPPTEPPLPPLSCTINGDINLAHGVLNQDNVNGNTKSVYAQVSCNREATVKITALANNGGDVVTLRPDGSLKTKLQVNNIAGATGATVRVPGSNGTSVLFSSTLSSNGNVAAGNFSASAVAVVAIL